MQHLKSKLRGEPEKLVQHLTISSDNYDSCWEILQNRYENKRLLFSSYMNTLLNLPTIQTAAAHNLKKMHDTLNECINGLTNIGLDVTTWDPLFVHLLLPKLDPTTYADYIHDIEHPRELPDLLHFQNFLEQKFMAFETLKQNQNTHKQEPIQKKQTSPQKQQFKSNDSRATNSKRFDKWSNAYYTTRQNCPHCKKSHTLMHCDAFKRMDVATRNRTVSKLQLCKNCLFNHPDGECVSTKTCKLCSKGHHTLLHENVDSSNNTQTSTAATKAANNVTSNDTEVLLTTVQVKAKNANGDYVTLRALLDQGSQVSLITETAAQRLRLKRSKMSAVITGVGATLGNSKGLITLECKSIHTDFTFTTEALVMSKLINDLPSSAIEITKWDHLHNLKLADPNFHVPGPIDVLLGADIYSLVIQDGVLKQDNCSPVAQHTKLGWILSGNIHKTFNCFVTLNDLTNLTKFWETEEVNGESGEASSDDYCEQYYQQTTTRLSTGQYVVKMPMSDDLKEKLGQSRPQAISQFLQLERRMARQDNFAKKYKQFIAEYSELGHMRPATRSTTDQLQVFLPHHGVIREDSTTTKLRVVFNASAKTDTKYSLNDLMRKGPNLQKDIFSLIIKWRSYKYALTADIEKMFRAIFLNEEQRPLQKIIWRSSPHEPLQELELCTVTYGTKAAPFLAMRTLKQLANDEGHAFPLAEPALRHQFYMDDVITGHQTIEGARALQRHLFDLLRKGRFTLRKWASNEPAVLQDLLETQRSQEHVFNFKQDAATKMLGIGWNTNDDNFCFNWGIAPRDRHTKRTLLSDISKLYDPLGWLSPLIISTKLLFQSVWNSTEKWDQPISDEMEKNWEKIRSELFHIKNISIPRWINGANGRIELHGLCDASEKAFACVIYTKTVNEQGDYVITLLTAKTKVAPLNKNPSLPRLELCGALLLAKLVEKVKAALSHQELEVYCWTDSKVVLAWLQGTNKKWERFISNRTAIINDIIPSTHWRHVKSKENPADCASRGLLPAQLLAHALWWEGPHWLKTGAEIIGSTIDTKFSTDEGSVYECCVTQSNYKNETIHNLLLRCSSMTRAARSLAWALRFIHRTCSKTSHLTYLTIEEVNDASERIVKAVQREFFCEDHESLQRKGSVDTKSRLLSLTPFLDPKGILRVGGRLHNSSLREETKHPAIIPHNSRLTEIIIDDAHTQTLHGGARLTLAQTRQLYWIVGGNRAVKGYLQHCIKCHRFKTSRNEQLMGNLPKARVTSSRPFTHTGVDFTGHVDVKINKGRGVKTSKAYIAIFICLATKAVHIELVSDLSTQTFLAALKRLCARRGTPKHMYSDNGTNFKGAARLLYEEFIQYETMTSPEFFKEISKQQIEWHFLCPHWPSAAGVWEAAVKSMKYHLKRVLGDQKLDFEQFTTLLAQIEACMNSRPLCPLTEDIDDLDYLTPGHFLTGSPTMSLPQNPCNEKSVDLRSKWNQAQLMHEHIWRRWSNEYLHQLQTKSKWLQPKPSINVGDLVLVKEDNLAPGKWAMARVLDLHPGNDGIVRVVTLKTQSSIIKRPVIKLSPLPKREETQLPPDGEKCNPPQKKRKRSTKGSLRNSYVTLFVLSLFTLLFGAYAPTEAAAVTRTHNMTPLDGNRPMYFDEIGNLQLIHDEWSLLVYYNLTTYWQGTAKIKRYIDNLGYICKRAQDRNPCEPTIAQLRHELQQIIDYNALLLGHNLNRKKRGYINGVGSLARTLFGVLDEDFAIKYQEDITKIQANENHLLQLIKNQTSIVETENDIIKSNEEFMKHQFDIIHDYITKTNDTMSKIVYKVELMSTMNDVNAASQTAGLISANLKRTQDMLLDTLVDVHNGRLNIHLLSPKQLISELHLIASRISKRVSLPVKSIEENVKDIYKMIYVKARVTSSYLLLEIHIPLISDDEYRIFHAIPLQIRQTNDDVISVIPASSHVAINFRKETYISMNQDDLSQCMHVSNESFMCDSNFPIRNLHNNIAPCEAKILSHQTDLHCLSTKTQCTDVWIKLHRTNRWLFSCCGNCNARVLCDDSIVATNLLDNGILDLREGCLLQKKDVTLFAYNHFGNTAQLNVDVPEIPDVNVQLNEDVQFNFSTIQLQPTKNQSQLHRELDELLKTQKHNEALPTVNLSSHDVHQYVVLYLLVGGAFAVITYVVVKLFKRKLAQRTDNKRPREIQTKNRKIEQRQVESYEMQPIPSSSLFAKPTVPMKPKRTFNFDTSGLNGTSE